MKTLSSLNLQEARAGLDKKEFSSVELTKACLEVVHTKESDLHAFVTILEKSALASAKQADELMSKNQAGDQPLLGIPLALKDNFLTKGERTTASSKVLDTFIPPYDATVTSKLKSAGAVIIGKTNMDAWAHGSSTETSDYGVTHNPWDLGKLPGGSSGGTAAAIAADEAIIGIGSETAGSIRQPASWCGIYGLKPTYGRVSRSGVIAMGSSLDCPGPMTKTVRDAATILEIIAGKDDYDATTANIPVEQYTQNLTTHITGMRIGIPKEYFMAETEAGINDLVMQAAKKLESLGATLVDISLINPKYSIADYTIIQRCEVSSNLGRYDGIRFGNDRTFFGSEAKRRIMLGTYALSSGYYDAYYKNAQKVRMLLKQDFDRVFGQVDAILAPTSPSTALPLGASKNHPMFGEIADILVEASSMVGLTGINVPVGLSSGLPVGMQLMGNHFAEQKILNLSYAYEQATNWRANSYNL